MKKKSILLLAVMLLPMALWGAESSFIGINNYSDGDTYYIYDTYDENAVRREIYGSVTRDCVSVRVIWSGDSQDTINEYLLNKAAGKTATYKYGLDDYTLSKYKAGDESFLYNIGGSLDNFKFGSNHYRFIAKYSDGTYKCCSLSLYFHTGGAMEKGKPVIYLYPKKTTKVNVKVEPIYGLTVSIPELGDGWDVTATPKGKITDNKTGETYPYLFWESHDKSDPIDLSTGFVVSESDLESFFDKKLTYLGLNKTEISDFKEFWIPILKGKPYVFITFASIEQINAEAPLTVEPAPDSVIRVFFDYKKLDAPIECEEQILTPAKRKGFAVVEWGGRLYK